MVEIKYAIAFTISKVIYYDISNTNMINFNYILYMFHSPMRQKYPETTQTEQNIRQWFAYYRAGHLEK